MNVFIIGHNGWIGKKFCNILDNNNINYKYSNLRAEDDNILKEILEYNTTHLYCCSGRTHGYINDIKYNTIDYLEDPSTLKENINDNLYVPLSLALFSDKNNIHFTYIGTGCIFDDSITKFNSQLETINGNIHKAHMGECREEYKRRRYYNSSSNNTF